MTTTNKEQRAAAAAHVFGESYVQSPRMVEWVRTGINADDHTGLAFDERDAKGRVVGCAVTQWTETVVRIANDDDKAKLSAGGRAALGDESLSYDWLDLEKRPVGTTTHHYHGLSTRDGVAFGGSMSGYNTPFLDIDERDQAAIAYVAAARKRSAAKAKKAKA